METLNTITPQTALGKRLVKAGFRIVKEVNLKFKGTGRWYEVITPDNQSALLLKQSESCWHVFGAAMWTASGSSIEQSYRGGLGDAIGTDSQMKTYKRLVLSAPQRLSREYDGLYAAQGQVYND